MTLYVASYIIKVSNNKGGYRMETTILEDLECKYSELGEMLFKLSGMAFEDEWSKSMIMKSIADEMQRVKDKIAKEQNENKTFDKE